MFVGCFGGEWLVNQGTGNCENMSSQPRRLAALVDCLMGCINPSHLTKRPQRREQRGPLRSTALAFVVGISITLYKQRSLGKAV